MENDLQQFIHTVEASAKKILKDHAKRAHMEAARDRVERARGHKPEQAPASISRDELKATYGQSVLIVPAPSNARPETMPVLASPRVAAAPVHPIPRSDPVQLPALRKHELREKATAKLLHSPLYKGLATKTPSVKAALAQLNAVNDLRTLGLGLAPARSTHVHEHSTERRMCNACWAEPTKRTRCEHGLHSNPRDLVEVQGAMSWNIDDLYHKYRAEAEREAAYAASEALQMTHDAAVVPILARHPLYTKYFYAVNQDNQYAQHLSRSKNKTKQFVLSVHTVWLSNLDHFNAVFHCNTTTTTGKGLCQRLDTTAIHDGYSQIQSVSAQCALQHTQDVRASPLFRAGAEMARAPPLATATIAGADRFVQRKSPIDDHGLVSLSVLSCGRMEHLGNVPGTVPLSAFPGLWWCHEPFTRPAAMYLRDARVSSSDTILVHVVLALDSPRLAPRWFAWVPGSVAAAIEREILFSFSEIPATTVVLLSPPHVESPLDAYWPSPVLLANGHDEHAPETPEFNATRFRQWLRYATIPPNFDLHAKAFGIRGGYLNRTGLSGRFSWHSDDAVDADDLVRVRLEKDYVVVAENKRSRGSNDPNMYTLEMRHEAIESVHTSGLHAFLSAKQKQREEERLQQQMREIEVKLQAGRLALDAKRAEKRRLEADALRKKERVQAERDGKAAIDASTVDEWRDRVAHSVLLREWQGWEERRHDPTHVVFYHHSNPELLNGSSWDPPHGWPLETDDAAPLEPPISSESPRSNPLDTDSGDENKKDGDDDGGDVARMAKQLAESEVFLELLRDKLGLLSKPKRAKHTAETEHDSSSESGDSENEDDDGIAARVLRTLEREPSIQETSTMSVKRLLRLQITKEASPTQPIRPGEGWKRLNVAKLPKSFAKKVYEPSIATPPPTAVAPNIPLVAGLIDPAKTGTYEQPNDVPDFRAHFVPSLEAEVVLMNKLLQSQAKRQKQTSIADVFAEMDDDDEPPSPVSDADNIRKAVLYTRNNNVKELESMFDAGVHVNAQDENGNSLFILACQQGNKNMCKFLMRRRCDTNMQNFRGNTGLHYCFEYKWHELAEYLKEKGVRDDIPNADGLMCYEGISSEHLAAL
ncbi:hypothetical protein SPRG_06054 [Saprolegnia parasitica CBS 223.65]|uniref:Uncharacterized protein n=1 Tax=Saprolegnia parasitica (strain CBS 223.65) TaxID=695850 RepID=A0A067CEL5_SAPPC|nr:hypothetical protein SPRG_06054 [Saprolegnia parasitica CBS 223.65]KDO28953.1 hypothetical protein SPRG_06054 [Saprolegnia parasitica CBS 223.65]|eukprot:XP_012200169.1 hypothetical protein SPRG_06054 [Saprolegnia parasitica CBS 223.65]